MSDETTQSHDVDVDVLLTRVIDGEAGARDWDHLENIADLDPSVWRELAIQQRDMMLLSKRVEEEALRADRTPLPRRWVAPARMGWTIALSGVAAIVILSVSLALSMMNQQRQLPNASSAPIRLTAIDHYEAYVDAPWVLGELQPVVFEVEEMSDGRLAVHYCRRIEEVAFLDPNGELPIDENGELTADLEKLRKAEPQVRLAQ